MATVIRDVDPIVRTMATVINGIRAQIGAGSSYHLDASEQTVTAADCTDLPTALVLCVQMIGVLRFHFADTLALKVADATSLPLVSDPIDLASAITAANLMRTSWGTHIASTAKHYNADSTNTISGTAAATDLASLITLLNAHKAVINTHMASAPAGHSLRVVGA
jgi:hypothetical protein